MVIGRGSNQQKFALPDDTFQVSDESALSIYERGPKVGSRSSSRNLISHVTFTSVFFRIGLRPRV